MRKAGKVSPIPLPRLDQVYHQHFEALVAYASRLLDGERSRAEDVVQEAFARLMQAPPEDMALTAGWLRVVVQHLCYDLFRKNSQERHWQEGLPATERGLAPSAEEVFIESVDRDHIVRSLRGLDPRESRALWLRHTGYRYREIAKELGIDPNQVGMVLLRAMKKLKAAYHQEEELAHGEDLPRRGHMVEISGSRNDGPRKRNIGGSS